MGGDDSQGVGNLLASFISKYPFTIYQGADGEAPAVKEVTLENTLTGCVIGDKGARIRDVRNSSGARIRIGKYEASSSVFKTPRYPKLKLLDPKGRISSMVWAV